jgi:hypothetical protein
VFNELASWAQRRMRQCLLAQWKKPRTRHRKLLGFGLSWSFAADLAFSRKGLWRLSLTPQIHRALDDAYWRSQKLIHLEELYLKRRTVS